MNYKLPLAIFAITATFTIPGHTKDTPFTMTQTIPLKALADALYLIGVSSSDIGDLEMSGKPSEELIRAYTTYANNSDYSRYDSLSQVERNALVFLGYKLLSKHLITNSSMANLMMAEKMRTEMPKAHIIELMNLVETLKANPNYELTFNDVMIIDSTAPFINVNPYAFSDILGALIGPILHAKPEDIKISSATEVILINAAKTITGLTQEQLDNLENITNTYKNYQEFNSSTTNVNDINQVTEIAYYPDGANLLLPFLGASALVVMSDIHYAYPTVFYGDAYVQYDATIVRDPVVETYYRAGYYPRYNDNWANTRDNTVDDAEQTRENTVNDAENTRENTVNDAESTRDNTVDERNETWDNSSDNRTEDRSDASQDRENASDNRSDDRENRSDDRSADRAGR